jgi:ribosomal protein S12 methylthiotransferase accessory factor
LRRLSAVAEQAVDPRSGLVHHLAPVDLPSGSPPLFQFAAYPCNLRACGWQSNGARMDAASARRQTAAAGALLEALRFYAAGFYERQELELLRSADDPGGCAVPSRFALFSAEQYERPDFPYLPFTERTPVRWVPGVDLDDGRPCRVPAARTLVPYEVPQGDDAEAAIAPATSAGLAAALTLEAAESAGLVGLLRDDAAAVLWHRRQAPPQIRVETLSDANYELVERFESTVGRLTLLDARTELDVPVVVACLPGQTAGMPARVFAAGAGVNAETAVREALEELALVLRYSREIQEAPPPLADTDEEPADPVGHLRYWCSADHTGEADFLFASSERVDFQSLPALDAGDAAGTRRALVERLGAAGLEVFAADLTTPDLRDLGVLVVRVVAPALQPLFFGRRRQALGGPRLRPSGASEPPPHPFLVRGVTR